MRPILPGHLGPLEDGGASQATDLLAENSPYLGRTARKGRARLWSAIGPTVERLLAADETVLDVLPAMRQLRLGQWIGLGWMAYRYNQVALVLTDRRLIEVRLDVGGKEPEGHMRSLPWPGVVSATMRMGSFKIRPAGRKTEAWTVRLSGDRKLLKRLLGRIQEKLLPKDGGAAETPEVRHCPGCGADWPTGQDACASCRAVPRSKGLAAGLALAFPGAGLLYVGHPVLATFDFLGEILLFAFVFLSLLGTAPGPERWGIMIAGTILFVFTKLESVHVAHLMIERGAVESPDRLDRWRRWIAPGAVLSALAIAGAVLFTDWASPVVERDLQFHAEGWVVSRDPAEWLAFADDPTARAQWSHEDGWIVFGFAYPLGPAETVDDYRSNFQSEPGVVSVRSLAEPLEGFRATLEYVDGDGAAAVQIHYFLYDPQGDDLHQLMMDCSREDQVLAEALLQDLVRTVAWIDAPDR